MNIKLLKSTYRTILLLAFISLSFIASDCNEIIETIVSDTGELTGSWRLIYNAGTLNDICPGENVEFQSNGVAVLSCPPGTSNSINRSYTSSNSILTYTETSVEYYIRKLTTSELELEGKNNNRYLYYTRVTSNDREQQPGSESKNNLNSSEK